MMTKRKPTIYFAGKISKNGWRNSIVRWGIAVGDGSQDERDLFNPYHRREQDAFYYGGPFFVRCNNGCGYQPMAHGSASCGGFFRPHERHPQILAINLERIRRADLVFAFINEVDCFGTLIELGAALRRPRPLVVSFGPDLLPAQRQELWMAECGATRIYEGSVETTWRQFATEFLPLYRPPPPPRLPPRSPHMITSRGGDPPSGA